MKTILPFLPVIFVSLIACTLQAQQLPLFSQYREYQGLINPGSVTNDYLTIGHTKAVGLSHRRQWKDIPNGISTQLARFEWFDPGTRLVSGGYLLRDVAGPTEQLGGVVRIGYVASADPKQSGIGLGLQFGLSQFRIRTDKITFRDAGDILAMDDLKSVFPDVGAGIFAYSALGTGWEGDKIYGGISVPQTFGLDINARDGQGKKFKLTRTQHFYANLGLIKSLRENFLVEPSVWAKYLPGAPLNIDFNLRAQAGEIVSFGFGYGTSKVLHAEATVLLGETVGIEGSRLKIGFSHDNYLDKTVMLFGPTNEVNFTFSF